MLMPNDLCISASRLSFDDCHTLGLGKESDESLPLVGRPSNNNFQVGIPLGSEGKVYRTELGIALYCSRTSAARSSTVISYGTKMVFKGIIYKLSSREQITSNT